MPSITIAFRLPALMLIMACTVGLITSPLAAQPSTANVGAFRLMQFELLAGKVAGDSSSSIAIPKVFAGGIRWNREAGAWRVDALQVNRERHSLSSYNYNSPTYSSTNTNESIESHHFFMVTGGGDAIWRHGYWFGSLGGGLGIAHGRSHTQETHDYTSTSSPPYHSAAATNETWTGRAWTVGIQGGYEPVVAGLHFVSLGRHGGMSLLTMGVRY